MYNLKINIMKKNFMLIRQKPWYFCKRPCLPEIIPRAASPPTYAKCAISALITLICRHGNGQTAISLTIWFTWKRFIRYHTAKAKWRLRVLHFLYAMFLKDLTWYRQNFIPNVNLNYRIFLPRKKCKSL